MQWLRNVSANIIYPGCRFIQVLRALLQYYRMGLGW